MDHTIGLKIRKVRELKNFSQQYVADKLSVSQGYYSDIENCKTNISEERLNEISNILDVNPDAIKSFNDQVVFNSCSQSGYLNTYNIPFDKIDKLYEEIIRSHEQRIEDLQKVIEAKNQIIELLEKRK
ncbi:hypothetical protein GCM10009118_28890 [Wandonia haliotis]|uniref:HTH cro/C1-type domain-containing protein n=1 Tax=Wandonia haliotis TaxID=574963 RepID=A0ABN1MT19_9FLAO